MAHPFYDFLGFFLSALIGILIGALAAFGLIVLFQECRIRRYLQRIREARHLFAARK